MWLHMEKIRVLLCLVNGRLGLDLEPEAESARLAQPFPGPMICQLAGRTHASLSRTECDMGSVPLRAVLETQTTPDGCGNEGGNSGIEGYPYDNLIRGVIVWFSRLCCGRSRGRSGKAGSTMWTAHWSFLGLKMRLCSLVSGARLCWQLEATRIARR
jgi:hypothetical protein